jgi:hypothetical protein
MVSNYEPTASEKYLTDFIIKNLYMKAKKFDKKFRENREDNRKFYKGNQWRRRQPDWKSKSVTNLLSVIIRDQVAILTDRIPIITAQPVDNSADNEIATIITKLLKHVMYKNDFGLLNHNAAKKAAVEGVSYFRPNWNPLLNNGQGDIEILLESADNVLVDPSGEKGFCIIEKDVNLSEIYRMFPEKAPLVQADIKNSFPINYGNTPRPTLPVQSTDGSQTVVYEDSNVEIVEQHMKVKLHIAWIKDETIEKVAIEEVRPEGEGKEKKPDKEMQYEYKVKYPYGRWVYIANEKIVLDDKPCVTKHFPVVPLILDTDPETDIYGISNIDYCKQTQIDYNEMNALIKDWLRAVTFPRFTYDPTTGINPSKIKNTWGLGVPAHPNLFRWDPPPQLPNDAFNYGAIQKDNVEYVSGIHDVTQGRRPANVSAASAIQMLQEASKTMIRPQARALESALKKLGLLLIDLMQWGYSEPRMVRILGAEGNPEEPIQINQSQVVEGVKEVKNNITIGEYDVFVSPDSTLPISRIERYGMMTELFDKGAVDRDALIDESGLPNKEQLKQRMMMREQQQREAEQRAQQAEEEHKKMIEERKIKRDEMKAQTEAEYKSADIQLRKEELALKARELELKNKEIEMKADVEVLKAKNTEKEGEPKPTQ